MRATVVLGDDLDVLVASIAIPVPVLDADVGEMHLLVEVGEAVLARPLARFFRAAVGVAVVVGAVAIAFVQPKLVLALEFVVEDNPVDMCATVLQPLRGAFVRTIDLDIMGELPLAFNAMPEGLTGTLVAVAMVLEQASAFFRERDGMLPRTGYSDRLNQPLLAQVSKVARARIERSIVLISKITTGDHSERPNRGERPCLRAAERVLPIANANDFALVPARQIEMPREDFARVVAALTLRPPRVITVLIGLPRVARTAPEFPPIVVAVATR